MRLSRLYIDKPLQAGQSVKLDGEELNYVSRVLRLKPGNAVTLFNGQGGEYSGTISELHKRQCIIDIDAFSDIDTESTLNITLVQCISRGERMDITLQKATELGIQRIQPVFSKHCTVVLEGKRLEKRHNHWQGVIRSACEQSGRNILPLLEPAIALNDYLATTTNNTCLLLDPLAKTSLKDLPVPDSDIQLLVGPEGGFSEQERQSAYDNGYQGVQLGPRVLRTETAAIAAMAAIQVLWGDF